jgi:hypothetical protein
MLIRYLVGGVLGALLGGISVWAMGAPAAPEEGRDAGEERVPRRVLERDGPDDDEDSAPGQPRTLAECKQALVRKDVEMRAVRATAARAVAGALMDDDEPMAGPTPAGGGGPGAGVGEPAAPSDPERDAERARWREASTKVRDALIEDLGMTQDEQRALADAVCPLRENERSLVLEFGDGSLDAEAFFASMAEERRASTQLMRQSLGAERYRRLRNVGGIAMLSRSLCRRGQ